MKKLIISILCICIIGAILVLLPQNKVYPLSDENTLYYTKINNRILRFERVDYALGQNQLVIVQESKNEGKSFENITKEPVLVSMKPKFIFLSKKLGFAIAKPNLTKDNDYNGFKVTQDGGKTFKNVVINYQPNAEYITIESVPYYENNILKFKASVYQIREDGNGYEDKELIFISRDSGVNWELEK